MKLLTKISVLFLSLFFLSILSNPLLQKPQSLTDSEINELAQNWETQFAWHYGKGCRFVCGYEKEQANFLLQLFLIPIRSYNFPYLENIKKIIESYKQNQSNYYYATPLIIKNPNPKKIDFYEFCELLKSKQFIFYTGAGTSSGRVATMKELEKSLTLDNKKEFLKNIFLNPKIISNAFSNFCTSAIYGLPRPAHYALHEIAQEKNICILTENFDLLQQRTGSMPILTHNSEFLHKVETKEFLEIDIIVCIGLSHDDCGFLAHYKQQNPQGLIVAVDLSVPNYLSNQDFLIQGDLQIILSNLADCLLN